MKQSAVVLLVLVSLSAAFSGLRYILATEFTPVHAQIVGQAWQQIDPKMQVLVLGMIKVMGAGQLGGSVSLLCFAYRAANGDRWPAWAAPLIAGVVWGPTLYVTLWMRTVNPAAETPVAITALLLVMVAVAGVLVHFANVKRTAMSA